MFRIVPHTIDAAALARSVGRDAAGAIVTFIGTTRDHHQGRKVHLLEYEAYEEMAVAELEKIGAEARRKFEIEAISIEHRIGAVPLGEASVVIAVAAAHRKAAFAACEFAIDRIKEVVPIWKKEHYDGGEIWIGAQNG